MEPKVTARSFASLKNWDSTHTFDVERQVREMVESPAWQVVIGLLAEAREDVVFQLTDRLREHVVMARLTGIADGLQGPQQAVNSILALADRWREELEHDVHELAGREQGG